MFIIMQRRKLFDLFSLLQYNFWVGQIYLTPTFGRMGWGHVLALPLGPDDRECGAGLSTSGQSWANNAPANEAADPRCAVFNCRFSTGLRASVFLCQSHFSGRGCTQQTPIEQQVTTACELHCERPVD